MKNKTMMSTLGFLVGWFTIIYNVYYLMPSIISGDVNLGWFYAAIILIVNMVTLTIGYIKNEWLYLLIAATGFALIVAPISAVFIYIVAFKTWKRS